MSLAKDSTTRFSNRVEDYIKWRPNYPQEIVKDLQNEYGLSTDKIIADIGSGTGMSSELFLKGGYHVIGVEPNAPMRNKSVELLQQYNKFKTIDGTAEVTKLDSNCIDIIIAGQAFHWFDRQKTKIEFKRILKPGGLVVLLWNERLVDTVFAKKYDQLITKYGKDYVEVGHRNIDDENIGAFFRAGSYELKTYKNQQMFDLDGLRGRLLSSSYMPTETDENYQPMLIALKELFDRHQQDGHIQIDYTTKVYIGKFE